MLKNRIEYIILLLIALALYIYTNEYYAFVLLLLLIFLPIFSLTFLLMSYHDINVDFHIPPILKKSQEATITFTSHNNSIFPVSGVIIYILCRNNLTGKEIETKELCPAGISKINDFSFTIADANSGQITVILKKVKVCDVFGLFSLSDKEAREKGGLIYPNTYDVKVFMDNPSEIQGEGERYSQTQKGQDVNEIFSLREYVQGDEIRKIHWKLSAKQDKLVVRDFGLPLNYPIFLLLEVFNDHTQNSSKALDACMEAFVSISQSLLDSGICHNIAWYDNAREKLMIKEISSRDELEAYLPDVLSIRSYTEDAFALRFYENSNYRNAQLVLVYVTTFVIPAEIAKRAVCQTVRTVYITETPDENTASYITSVNPETIEEDISHFTI